MGGRSILAIVNIVCCCLTHHVFAEALVRDEVKSAGEDSTAIETSFEELTFDAGEEFRRMLVPQRIDELDGKRVRIRGYMWPSFKQQGIGQFVLMENAQYKLRARPDEIIPVHVKHGWGTEYTTRAIIVEGRFIIDPVVGEKHIITLYWLEDATVFTTAGEKWIAPLKADEIETSEPSPSQPD